MTTTGDHAVTLPEGTSSIENVCQLEVIAGPGARGTPDLFFEVPHGATERRHYDTLKLKLSPDLPDDLIDFFFVNTDVGAFEYARRAAAAIVGAESDGPPRSVALLRCLIPRTFIDTNRVVDVSTRATQGVLTAALGEYVRDTEDARTLIGLHQKYHVVAGRLYDTVCGAGGLALNAHTYAPKTISIDTFDEGIGKALRAAYEPETYAQWSTRPEVDIITHDPGGQRLAPHDVVERIIAGYAEIGIEATESATYTLHPESMGYVYAARYPGQVLCMEIRRDLLADPFSPFEEMSIGEEKVARAAAPIANAFLEALARRA